MYSQQDHRRTFMNEGGISGGGKPGKKLDDFFAKSNGSSNTDQHYDECDISLCTATTKIVSRPENNCTWKRHSQAVNPVRKIQAWGGSFSSLTHNRGLNQSMMLMQVKEENDEDSNKSGSQFGVTIGVGNLLYKPQSRETLDEERSDLAHCRRSSADSLHRSGDESVYTETSEYLILGKSSVSCTYSTSDESSIEVSMPLNQGYEFDTRKKSNYGALYEKARLAEEKFMEVEARLEDQKRLVREQLLADEVQLVEMTRETKACHLQKDQLLSKPYVENACNAEDVKLSFTMRNLLDTLKKKRNMFKSIRLEEEKQLVEEERRLAEKRRLFEEAYQLEEARLVEQTHLAEVRLLEEARLSEERYQAIQKRLEQISSQVELARENAEEARLLVHDDARVADSLTFDDTFSVCGEKLQTLSEEKPCDPCAADIGYDSLAEHHWKELNAPIFSVRGEHYFQDSKKVPSAPNLLRLITVDLIQVEEPMMTGFCSHPRGRVQKMLHFEKQNNSDLPDVYQMPPFVFCVNLVLPGPPHYHICMYFAVDDLEQLGLSNQLKKEKKKQYSTSLQKFLFGSSDEYRNRALKMIPRVTEGSFLLKTAVGTKPFILGKYLEQTFVRDERYLEAIVDVGSSPITQKLLGLSSVYKNKIVAGMAFVLEANDAESLPENIMCSIEVNNEHFDGTVPFFDDAL